VWAYFLSWAAKSSCIRVFHTFGKNLSTLKKSGGPRLWAPPTSPAWPAGAIIFLIYFIKPNNSFLVHMWTKEVATSFDDSLSLFSRWEYLNPKIGVTTSCIQYFLGKINFEISARFNQNLTTAFWAEWSWIWQKACNLSINSILYSVLLYLSSF
jgi:hypothetical protein